MVTDVLQSEGTRENLTCDSFGIGSVYGWPDQDIRYLSVVALEETIIVVKPVTPVGAQIRQKFHELAECWKRETIFESSVERTIAHPAYQQIVAMGVIALPLILEDLAKAPDFWFWALSAITGESPEPSGSAGNIAVMAQAWLDWGKARHLI